MRVIYCRSGGKVFEGCDVGVVEFFLLRPLNLVGLKQLVVGLAEVIAVFDELLDTAVVLSFISDMMSFMRQMLSASLSAPPAILSTILCTDSRRLSACRIRRELTCIISSTDSRKNVPKIT